MTRNRFLFSDSARLYQQSEDLAAVLLPALQNEGAPFRETLGVLTRAGATKLEDPSSRSRATDLAWKYLTAVGSALDSRAVIPGLLETIETYYYANANSIKAMPWLGTALKTALAVIWANRGTVGASMKAHTQVKRLVAAAGAWEQLALHADTSQAMEQGAALFVGEGISLASSGDEIMRNEWNAYSAKRGLSLRRLESCRQVIWQSGSAFMEAVAEVLSGANPSRIGLFQGTIFEEIQNSQEFWLGLSARVQLLAHAAKFRSVGRGDRIGGISLFEKFASPSRFIGSDPTKANAAIQSMFWQPGWHASRLRSRDFLSNMLIERPALRIDDRTFVVAMTNIGDSINCFVEHSVFRCFGYAGVPVSEEAFRRFVSQPFEDRTIECFVARGWKADHISESGMWCGTSLRHPSGIPIPGEVDVLALHPGGRIAVIAECKVLVSPFSSTKLLNVSRKLGAIDSDGFHSKLQRKADWLRQTPAFEKLVLLQLLVVDEGAVVARNSPSPVVDIDALSAFIDARELEATKQL